MNRKVYQYKSDNIVVTYDKGRCIHAAECVRGLPQVFDVKKRPWIQPDQAVADQVAAVVMRCPTGALHFQRQDGSAGEPAPETNTIKPAANGPLYLRGDIEIYDSAGNLLLQDTRVALCRCGASRDKPFCDGSHSQAGFIDEGQLGENKLGPKEMLQGKLKVVLAENGPLLLDGPIELYTAGQQLGAEGGKGALCRCGGSQNKPYCDGSHHHIGFEAE
ncbi:MAG TPA: CDGSH iron-sulfur domain-containing protein [Anaerolineae bacterium]|nr:CDGSH iron-sulfur domain-containing protein [Anaerolineae bacterium]